MRCAAWVSSSATRSTSALTSTTPQRCCATGRWSSIIASASCPNYRVFDEKRYFRAGSEATVFTHRGFRIGLLVCEDIWECDAARQAREAGAELLLIINASPYEVHKQAEREQVVRERIMDVALPVAYVNMLGGQDELVFDGNSFVMDAQGAVVMRAPASRKARTWSSSSAAAAASCRCRAASHRNCRMWRACTRRWCSGCATM